MNWISVKDRLPDDSEDVLIYFKKKIRYDHLRIAYHSKNGASNWNLPSGTSPYIQDKLKSVTHWMPLPDKPAEEG